MFDRKQSTYRCPSCGRKSEAPPGTRISCTNCNQLMIEAAKGIINKIVGACYIRKPIWKRN